MKEIKAVIHLWMLDKVLEGLQEIENLPAATVSKVDGYLLHLALREFGLKGTEMETAQAATVGTKLLKIGGRIRVSVRRV